MKHEPNGVSLAILREIAALGSITAFIVVFWIWIGAFQ